MIYARIKQLCSEKKLTITGLEKELGFAKGSLSKIDKNRPGSDRLQKLADRLGVSTTFLLTGENDDGYNYDKETAKLAQELFENKALSKLLAVSKKIPPEVLMTLTAFLEGMTKE